MIVTPDQPVEHVCEEFGSIYSTQKMAALEGNTNLVAEGRYIIPNKAAPLAVTSDVEEPSIFCLNLASVVQKRT